RQRNSTVERYEGTVARLMGDGVLAFFGAPTAHEDDPERAVRCGLDMVREIDALSAAQKSPDAHSLRVRVGINSGPVVVGVVGTETANEYTAMGDTVNVAARMQGNARPGPLDGRTGPLLRGEGSLPPRCRRRAFAHRRERCRG